MKKILITGAIFVVVCLVAAFSLEFIAKIPMPIQVNENGIAYFSSEEELLSYVESHFVNNYLYIDDEYDITYGIVFESTAEAESPSVAPTAPTPESKNESVTMDSANDVSSTNVQVEGIDEGDILKTDGRFIYVIRETMFSIIDITEETPKEVSVTSLCNNEGYAHIVDMYVKGDSAIIISNENIRSSKDGNDIIKGYYNSYKNYTVVRIYDISDRNEPKETRKLAFEGSLISSRETNGKLYLVNNKYLYRYDAVPLIEDIVPEITDTVTGDCTPTATDIAKCIWPSPQSNIMTIAIIDYTTDSEPETLHMMGSGSDIYMNAQNLYVFSNGYNQDTGETTEIAKYSITDGIKSIGTAAVPGHTSTQFAYDEYNGRFRIATTAFVYNGKSSTSVNNIYVYDENMELCGSLTGLAPTENIKSARFMGDTAYLVTFRQVDPLFVIDMSENDPKVVGELKIPGFSTYLHPVGEGLLLGIGSETVDNVYDGWVSTSVSGLKVSLFDVSDPANPTEVDVASYVGGKNAYSIAKDNHNAFVYSASTNTGYFPITTYDEMWNSSETLAEVKITNEGIDVKVAELNKIYNYYSESRVCYSGEYLYLYRNCAITKINRETLEFICEINLTTP